MTNEVEGIRYVISVGSNTIDCLTRVGAALDWLAALLTSACRSNVYNTRPINGIGRDYANAVIGGESSMSIDQLNRVLKDYERANGRLPGGLDVVIDIDIVVAGDVVVRPSDFARDYFTIGYNQIKHLLQRQ